MAFIIEQKLEDTQYDYDREADVLYVSFGAPRPAVTLVVEEWLAIRMTPSPPQICGLTIVGFRRIFSSVRPDLIRELPRRMDRLKKARIVVQYSDDADTLAFRLEEEQPAYYERFSDNVYLEMSLVGNGIIGFKITRYTEQGGQAMEKLLASMVDALFTPPAAEYGSVDALTRAFLEHVDIGKLLTVAA